MEDNLNRQFKDYKNNKSTDDKAELLQYLTDTPLKYSGVKDCDLCGAKNTLVTYNGTLNKSRKKIPPAICSNCKAQYLTNGETSNG